MTLILTIAIIAMSGCRVINFPNGSVSNVLNFTVECKSLASYDVFTYVVSGEEIFVLQNKEIIYKRNLNNEELSRLRVYEDVLDKIGVYYDSPVLDGMEWKVVIQRKGEVDFVYLNNYCLDEINKLFKCINDCIPDGVPRIIIRQDCSELN